MIFDWNRQSRIGCLRNMKSVVVTGSFDDLRSKQVRFLEEAAKWGKVHVGLWSDEALLALGTKPPKFPEQERFYLLQSLRFVDQVSLLKGKTQPDALPELEAFRSSTWIVDEGSDSPGKRPMQERGNPLRRDKESGV